MTNRLLPQNASAYEQALEDVRSGVSDLPVDIRTLWDPDTCPEAFLPWFAWTLSVDFWDEGWPVHYKREIIKTAYDIHKIKGTVDSLRRILQAVGYGDATILEGLDAEFYDGAINYNGDYFYGQADIHWAMYRVYLDRPISIKQAEQVRKLLKITAPARCKLESLDYTQALNLYDGAINYDGAYTHGVA